MLANVLGLIMFALWAFQIHLWKHYTSLETFWSTVMVDSHTSWCWNFTAFMLSTCAQLLQWLRYFGFHFTQVPHTYCVSQPLPSHVSRSRNRHRMCLGQGIGTEKALKLTFIHKGSKLDCFYAVNLWQTVSIIEVFWIPLYTGTPHILCVPTTTIACVFVME